jgi:hypothetical protein
MKAARAASMAEFKRAFNSPSGAAGGRLGKWARLRQSFRQANDGCVVSEAERLWWLARIEAYELWHKERASLAGYNSHKEPFWNMGGEYSDQEVFDAQDFAYELLCICGKKFLLTVGDRTDEVNPLVVRSLHTDLLRFGKEGY